ncbi:MAG TPA: ABC transporter permease [Clostridia bacterium]|nr:ABC transporter permease [Clostridia bacterium]
MASMQNFIKKVGIARFIIAAFLLFMLIIAPFAGLRLDLTISDMITRFGMYSVLILSLIPMIQSGCGLNFGLPLGVIAGTFGAVCSLELQLKGYAGLFAAMIIGTIVAIIIGYLYGKLLNMVKGDEMMIATYVGFASVAFMSIVWVVLPFKNPHLILGYGGNGMRQTINLDVYWMNKLSDILVIKIGPYFKFQTGMFLFFALMCFLVWGFFKTKTGTAMTAVGSNPDYARAAGIDVDKIRTLSVVLSTVIAAIGIVVYAQSFGFIQLYTAPVNHTFSTIAAILIGGAAINKASIKNVIIGGFLSFGILYLAPVVINSTIKLDIADVVRLLVSNGMILYALTRKER